MAYLLDIIGMSIIAGFILLMIINSNIRTSEFSDELMLTSINQSDVAIGKEIIEHDFYKIGYKVNGEKIKKADSTIIIYYTDIATQIYPEGNGSTDSIEYRFDKSTEINATENPDDYPLYKVENDIEQFLIGRLTKFKLSYYDSLGQYLTYSSLIHNTNRKKIRSIYICAEISSAFAIDSTYKINIWEKTIRPKNIN